MFAAAPAALSVGHRSQRFSIFDHCRPNWTGNGSGEVENKAINLSCRAFVEFRLRDASTAATHYESCDTVRVRAVVWRWLRDLVEDASVLLSHLRQSQMQLLFRGRRGRLEGIVQPSPPVAMYKQLLT